MQNITPIVIRQLSFTLPTGKLLFDKLNLTLRTQRIGLVGRNGIGKSTLLKIIAGDLPCQFGTIEKINHIAYVPQNPIIPPQYSVVDALGITNKINALYRIRAGSINEQDYIILADDWNIEQRCQQQLVEFGLQYLALDRQIVTLSGGELTQLLLINAFISDANYLLLDEPTNHLDTSAKLHLEQLIKQDKRGILIVSHDRRLLNCMDEIIELTTLGAKSYSGNYDVYYQQKMTEVAANQQQLADAKKEVKRVQNSIQLTTEKHAKRAAYGNKLRRQGKIDKLSANSAKGRSERSQSKMLIKEERLIETTQQNLTEAKEKVEIIETINIDIPDTFVPNGKLLLEIENLLFKYANTNQPIINDFCLKIMGPERIALSGDNGSGKTTLVKLILGELSPTTGSLNTFNTKVAYLDQKTSILSMEKSILDNFRLINPDQTDNDAYMILARFLFKNEHARQLVGELSGGEKLRAALACILMAKKPPQLLILDEPTNHLDLDSLRQVESALSCFKGALIVISHDQHFLQEIKVTKTIYAPLSSNN